MDVEDYLLLFISLWVITSALATHSIDVFLTLTLIGLLIVIEVGSLHLSKEQKEDIRPILELFLLVFTLIVLKKIYEVLAR